MAETIRIIDTGDGSHTLLNLAMDETYHSRHGALRESQHVFIQHGIQHWKSLHPDQEKLNIFEMGMGTGLNLILTVQQALEWTNVDFAYTTLEAFPLSWDTVQQLNHLQLIQNSRLYTCFEKIHKSAWNEPVEILPNFRLEKKSIKLEGFTIAKELFDLVYYDAFAPNKQPELWTAEVMRSIYQMMKDGGVFVTYSAKGQLKRDLKELGLKVETLPGPPGKAEMVRATKEVELRH